MRISLENKARKEDKDSNVEKKEEKLGPIVSKRTKGWSRIRGEIARVKEVKPKFPRLEQRIEERGLAKLEFPPQ